MASHQTSLIRVDGRAGSIVSPALDETVEGVPRARGSPHVSVAFQGIGRFEVPAVFTALNQGFSGVDGSTVWLTRHEVTDEANS